MWWRNVWTYHMYCRAEIVWPVPEGYINARAEERRVRPEPKGSCFDLLPAKGSIESEYVEKQGAALLWDGSVVRLHNNLETLVFFRGHQYASTWIGNRVVSTGYLLPNQRQLCEWYTWDYVADIPWGRNEDDSDGWLDIATQGVWGREISASVCEESGNTFAEEERRKGTEERIVL